MEGAGPHEFKATLKRASRRRAICSKTKLQPQLVIPDDVEYGEQLGDTYIHKWATEMHDSMSLIRKGDAIARGAPEINGVGSWGRVCQW